MELKTMKLCNSQTGTTIHKIVNEDINDIGTLNLS